MSTKPPTLSSSTINKQGSGSLDPMLGGALVALSAIFLWIFWSFLRRQFQWAIQDQADWGHTLVMPFIACWFIYLNRRRIFAEPFSIAWSGLVLIIVGVSVYSLSALGPMMLRHHNIMGFGVGISIFGLILFFCGWRAMRWLWFPALYLVVFGQTVSDRFLEIVTYQLQDIAAVGSFYGLSLIGFDVERSGNTLQLFHQGEMVPVNIAEACSGMRMLVAFLALGVAIAYVGFPFRTRYPFLTLWIIFMRVFSRRSVGSSARSRGMMVIWTLSQRVLLVLLAFPTAVFVNILRVMTLGILATRDTQFAAGDFHTMVGMLWLIPAFLIYMGIVWILKQLVVHEDEPGSSLAEEDQGVEIRFGSNTRTAFFTAIVILVGGGLFIQTAARSLGVYLEKEPVAPRFALDTIPYKVGPWFSSREMERRMDDAGVEQLGTERYLTRQYFNSDEPGSPPIQLHIAYYTGHIDTIPHVPDRCLVAGGLTQEQAEPINYDVEIDQSQWTIDPDNTLDGQPYRLVGLERVDGLEETTRMPVGEFKLRTTRFGEPKNPDVSVFAGYFFIANGRLTPDPWGVKLLAFKPEDKKAYFCKVQLTTAWNKPLSTERFIDMSTSFLESMIPEIARCLPDWVDVSAETVTQ
jgi:exosortase